MHIHIGVLKSFLTFLDVIVWGFFWRIIAMMNSDNATGQAMGFIY